MTFVAKLSDEQRRKLIVDFEDGFRINQLVERYGVSVRTVQRILADAEMPHIYNYKRKRAKPKRNPVKLKPCGTNAAYRRHKRKGEYPCCACLAAHAEDTANRRK